MNGQRLAYKRVSTLTQSTARQLDGLEFDEIFEDKLSGKDTHRPQLEAMMKHARKGDRVYCSSMDRMARNFDDLRAIVLGLNKRGVEVEFLKEGLTFTVDDNAMSKLLLSMMGAFAEFEHSLILERQREGIAIAQANGVYKGRKPSLSQDKADELRSRVASGENKTTMSAGAKLGHSAPRERRSAAE